MSIIKPIQIVRQSQIGNSAVSALVATLISMAAMFMAWHEVSSFTQAKEDKAEATLAQIDELRENVLSKDKSNPEVKKNAVASVVRK